MNLYMGKAGTHIARVREDGSPLSGRTLLKAGLMVQCLEKRGYVVEVCAGGQLLVEVAGCGLLRWVSLFCVAVCDDFGLAHMVGEEETMKLGI